MNKKYAVYLLVRTDLPSLNPGKAMAQSHHAGFQLAMKYHNNKLVKAYCEQGINDGAEHFNTTLTLGATLEQIGKCMKEVSQLGQNALTDVITDPEYPFLVNREVAGLIKGCTRVKDVDDMVLFYRKEITCAYALGDINDPAFKDIFAHLSLHK